EVSMKTSRVLVPLVLSLVATAALAQQPPFPVVASVTPGSGPAAGGSVVTISGSKFDLPAGFACIAPCPARVFFGEAEATVTEAGSSTIVAVTPPHPSGPVDVTVRTGDNRSSTLSNG